MLKEVLKLVWELLKLCGLVLVAAVLIWFMIKAATI